MRHGALIASLLLATTLLPSAAVSEDRLTSVILQLFNKACVSNLGNPPDGIRAFAAAHNLKPITDQTLLHVFAGPGPYGAAWEIPAQPWEPAQPPRHYALSIRGTTQGCSIFANYVDVPQTEAQFAKLIEGTARPELAVKDDGVKTQSTKIGVVKVMNYHIFSPTSGQGYEAILVIGEHPGPLFQASVEISRVAPH